MRGPLTSTRSRLRARAACAAGTRRLRRARRLRARRPSAGLRAGGVVVKLRRPSRLDELLEAISLTDTGVTCLLVILVPVVFVVAIYALWLLFTT